MKNAIKTKHRLDFEVSVWARNENILLYRIGTCEGQWFSLEHAYCIMSVMNSKPGNGHLDDVFEWFEYAAKRDGKALIILELMNDRFKNHLIQKRGFVQVPGKDDVIKLFNPNPKNRTMKTFADIQKDMFNEIYKSP